jgi:cathepsin A (carboxypeptidase C)
MNQRYSVIVMVLALLGAVLGFQRMTKEVIHKSVWPEANHPGYVQIGPNPENEMFYWFFPSRRAPSADPLILWLTGGPGCSSEIALFVENGPFRIDKKTMEVGTNPWSWNTRANLIYIDQPLGTGLSTVDPKNLIKTEQEISIEVYTFLTKFLELFPSLKGRDFYVFGESYAGHYVPNISNYIFHKKNPNLILKGAAIGNGLPDPWVQYSAYAEFSLYNQLISFDTYLKMLPLFRQCETMMQYNIKGGREKCDTLYG